MSPSDASSASSDLRRLLLDAAREILREPRTSLDLRKVAERAGKSRTAPYLVFGKEKDGGGLLGLKIAVAAEGAREMAERMEAAVDVDPWDPMAALQAVAEAFLGFVEENRRLFRLMYGPDLGALPRLGNEAFLDHPEVQSLLEHRNRAGLVVTGIIRRAQADEFLSPDPPDDQGTPYRQSPSGRRLQIAWSAMVGVAFLREDELLRAVDWQIDRATGGRLIVESVFGIDPQAVGEAAGAFLESPEGVDASEGELEMLKVAEEVASFAREISTPMAAPPAAPPMASSMAAPPDDPEATLTRTLARHSGFNRAARSQTTLSRARILWIDDHPKWVAKPVETLRRLGARVTIVRTTQDGIRALGRVPGPDSRPFDVILSDIARGSRMDAGIRALPQLKQLAPDTPVIFFVGKLDRSLGVPKGAAGITNRTNELLHLVMDALEGR